MVAIRLATLEDAPVLARLVLEVQHLHALKRPDIFKPADDAGSFETDFRERILTDPNGSVFLAEVAKQAVGYVYSSVVERSESPYTFVRHYVHIDQICVKSEFRGRGCGQALVQAVFALAKERGSTHVTLSTWAFNSDAQAFFAAQGFRPYIFSMEAVID